MNKISSAAMAAIEPFISEWGLPTAAERVAKRTASSMEEINAFYEAMLPWMEEIINYLNQFHLSNIPAKAEPVAYAALAMCEIDNPVRWKEIELSSGFEVRCMIEKQSFYDSRLAAAPS